MKVFVAWGYHDRNNWIPEMVVPILQAFGIEVVTGEEMPGEIISEGVKKRIKDCHALLGFYTRCDDSGNTSEWVKNEVAMAIGTNCKIIEVWEDSAVSRQPLTEGRQHLIYNEAQRDRFLVKLVKAISQWGTVPIQLLPSEFSEKVRLLLRRQEKLECEYQFSIDDWYSDWYTGRLIRQPSGVVVIFANTSELPGHREKVLIQVRFRDPFTDEKWATADPQSLEQRIVNMVLEEPKK